MRTPSLALLLLAALVTACDPTAKTVGPEKTDFTKHASLMTATPACSGPDCVNKDAPSHVKDTPPKHPGKCLICPPSDKNNLRKPVTP